MPSALLTLDSRKWTSSKFQSRFTGAEQLLEMITAVTKLPQLSSVYTSSPHRAGGMVCSLSLVYLLRSSVRLCGKL